ncbi:MAG TPA: hypothetical protein VMS00_08375 [Acidimicrobiales bacterium]|nr:hypothetical protein [Acidimicrobiales bacterium]
MLADRHHKSRWVAVVVVPLVVASMLMAVVVGLVRPTSASAQVPAGAPISWATATSLPAPLYMSTSVAYNGYVYELGGTNASNFQSAVYYAQLNSNGSAGSWTSTTPLPAAIYAATSVVYNGFIYLIGGSNRGTWVSTVYYAPINANGTVGSWSATTSLPEALAAATSVVYNGYVYELGGTTSSNGGWPSSTGQQSAVYDAAINANGTIGTWATTTALPEALWDATSVIYNGYVYELGGQNGSTDQSATYYAPINTNGSIGTWATTAALPQAMWAGTSAVYDGYVYALGGYNGSGPQSSVYYAPINANGTIGTWSSSTSLPLTQELATTVAYNGYVYELGGDGTGPSSSVYYAQLNVPQGAVSSWATASALPVPLYYSTSVAYNGYLYELGGTNASNFQSAVYYAPLNSNGTTGSWTSTTSLPQALWGATSIAYNGYIYMLGGSTSTTIVSTVYYAPINTNGTIVMRPGFHDCSGY